MPLWMPPWLLSTMLVDLLCATMFQLREFMFSGWSTAYMPVIQQSLSQWLGRESGGTVFGTFFMVGLFAGLCYLPAAIPSMFSFVRKLHRHGLMLDQLEHFDVRRAKCTLESDRTYIEQEITKLLSWQLVESLSFLLVGSGGVGGLGGGGVGGGDGSGGGVGGDGGWEVKPAVLKSRCLLGSMFCGRRFSAGSSGSLAKRAMRWPRPLPANGWLQ